MAGGRSRGSGVSQSVASSEADSQHAASSPYFTRSQVDGGYKAAGVLPFAIRMSGGHPEPFVLLGGEPTRTGPKGCVRRTMWGDFGGHREAIDEGCSIATASREFAEETLGIFASPLVNMQSVAASMRSMSERLSGGLSFHVTHKLRRGEYRMYVAETPFVDPMFFHLAAEANLASGAIAGGEKTAFAWVPLTDLLATVAEARKVYFLSRDAQRRAVLGAYYPGGMQLHPCFATTMRLAMASGLAELVGTAQDAAMCPPVPRCMQQAGASCPSTAADRGRVAGGKRKQHDTTQGIRGPHQRQSVRAEPLGPKHLLYWVSQDAVRAQLLAAK